jgi:hypothetical protein
MRQLHISLITACVLACAPAFAADTMAKGEYKAEKERIQATHKVDLKACDAMKDNAKDICREEVKGKEKVALAELEYKNSAKPDDMNKVTKAKAEATYEVAKERCDDQSGAAKDACQATAKAEFEKAKAGS